MLAMVFLSRKLAVRCRYSGSAPHPAEAADRDQDARETRELGDAEGPQPEAVEPQGLDGESPDRIETDIPEGEPSRPVAPARPEPGHEYDEHAEVPQRFVEKRRMEALHAFVLERPPSGRDEEAPRQIGRPPECFLVEEVPPPPDGLRQRDTGRGDVERAPHREPATYRHERPHGNARDEPAVDGEPTFPHRGDLLPVGTEVVPVECH